MKNKTILKNKTLLACICIFSAQTLVSDFSQKLLAGPTKVGNANDGRDLEELQAVEAGILIETRDRALEKIAALNVAGIMGLGQLAHELKNSKIYLASKDADATSYARTFAEPNAPTRFFPRALTLSSDQLEAVHIHEALHRALPHAHRENEDIVATLTLAINSPGATHDRVREKAENLLRDTPAQNTANNTAYTPLVSPKEYKRALDRFLYPSSVSLGHKVFRSQTDEQVLQYQSLTSLETFLYPFGGPESAWGLGLSVSLSGSGEETQMGPLGLSARGKILSTRAFDVAIWGELGLNVLSADELRNSVLGRDTLSLGVSLFKEKEYSYIEMKMGVTMPGTLDSKIGNVDYQYEYGAITSVGLQGGVRLNNLRLGAHLDIDVGNDFSISSKAFSESTGRYRLVTAGPIVGFEWKQLLISANASFVLDKTKGATLNTLGNLLNRGSGEQQVGLMLVYRL